MQYKLYFICVCGSLSSRFKKTTKLDLNLRCACSCCSSTNHHACTVQCPTCFAVNLGMSYTPYGFGTSHRNVSYSQDFKQNRGDAEAFENEYAVGTTHKCYYNKKNLDEVSVGFLRCESVGANLTRLEISLDVSFTRWKWAITAVFGMVPLLAVMLYGGHMLCFSSIIDKVRRQRGKFVFPLSREKNEPERT